MFSFFKKNTEKKWIKLNLYLFFRFLLNRSLSYTSYVITYFTLLFQSNTIQSFIHPSSRSHLIQPFIYHIPSSIHSIPFLLQPYAKSYVFLITLPWKETEPIRHHSIGCFILSFIRSSLPFFVCLFVFNRCFSLLSKVTSLPLPLPYLSLSLFFFSVFFSFIDSSFFWVLFPPHPSSYSFIHSFILYDYKI